MPPAPTRSAHPLANVIRRFAALFALSTVAAAIVASTSRAIALNESQILYLTSTSAQVIAAVYGLTLTGFVFFRNELSREESEDESLREAVESLKARYFGFLWFITALVIVSLLLANLTIASENSAKIPFKNFILNAGQAAFFTSLLAVAYFVFDVISPKRIERASKGLQSGLDPQVAGQRTGNLDEFLNNYNQIEALLDDAGREFHVSASTEDERRFRRRMPNVRLAEILVRSGRIDGRLHRTLRDVITLRNAIIHGGDPVVSEEMVKASGEVFQALKASLAKGGGRRR
jgi:hypothetical protein